MIARWRGSPPRLRGKPKYCPTAQPTPRLTPAPAGKTLLQRSNRVPSWAHPRACGENGDVTITSCTNVGSPPRLRGKRKPPGLTASKTRLTPAPAGKTAQNPRPNFIQQAHPRACGENQCAYISSFCKIGSPPRLRGKLCGSRQFNSKFRLTPAPAGKTLRHLSLRLSPRAHPRACGENQAAMVCRKPCKGSPPRLRGKPLRR